MEIKHGRQVDFKSVTDLNVNLFLFAGNHEKRVFTCLDGIGKNNLIHETIMLSYGDEISYGSRKVVPKVINDHTEIYDILEKVFSKYEGDVFNLVVDYSCMTKSWYYSIILFLSKKKLCIENINVYFSYTPSKFSTPHSPKPNKDISPLPGKYIVPTDKPKALVVCLGYEENKAQGIIDHLDPKEAYIFYSKPVLDDRFVKKIEENNKHILSEIKTNKIITFPFDDLLNLERELTAVYFELKDEYSVIIAPLGPKPFTFISMLLSTKYKDIDIWRVGSGSDINLYKREPLPVENMIICQVVFISN